MRNVLNVPSVLLADNEIFIEGQIGFFQELEFFKVKSFLDKWLIFSYQEQICLEDCNGSPLRKQDTLFQPNTHNFADIFIVSPRLNHFKTQAVFLLSLECWNLLLYDSVLFETQERYQDY